MADITHYQMLIDGVWVDASDGSRFNSVNPAPAKYGRYCLRRLGDLLIEKSEELGRIECIDTGKMYKETRWQAKYVAEFYYFFAGCADKVNGDSLPIVWIDTSSEPLANQFVAR